MRCPLLGVNPPTSKCDFNCVFYSKSTNGDCKENCLLRRALIKYLSDGDEQRSKRS